MKWTNSIASRIKMRDLQIVHSVATSGGIGKAAIELAISQPAISKAIANLETELGVPLFDRTPSGVQITPYGAALLDSARAIFDSLRQGVTAIDVLADPTAGLVRIGTTPPLAAGFVPAMIGALSEQYRRLETSLIQGDVGNLQILLRERAIDFAIATSPVISQQEDVVLEPLFYDWHVPAASTRSKWVRRRKLKWADVQEEPWVLPPTTIALWPFLARDFHDSGLTPPRATVATASIPAHLRLIETGRFLSLLPNSILAFADGAVCRLNLPSPVKARPVFIITLKNRTISPSIKTFIDFVRYFAAKSRRLQTSRQNQGETKPR